MVGIGGGEKIYTTIDKGNRCREWGGCWYTPWTKEIKDTNPQVGSYALSPLFCTG
jgi:hypothetical protein